MKYIAFLIVKYILRLLYLPMKLRPVKDRVVFLSRESKKKSLDMRLLSEELARTAPEIEQVFRLFMMEPGLSGKIAYGWHMLGDMWALAGARIAICDTYSIPVSCLHHKPSLYVIQMWHSMGALKQFGYQSIGKKEGRSAAVSRAMDMHRGYDCVFAPSKATGAFYMEAFDVTEDKIFLYTLPRIDYLMRDVAETRERFLAENPDAVGKKIVVYLPTFRSGEEAAVESLRRVFEDQPDITFIPSVHPLSGIKVSRGINGSYNTMDLIKAADAVITDYSACAFEAAVLERELYFFVPDREEYDTNRGINIDLRSEMPGCVFDDPDELCAAVRAGACDRALASRFGEKYVENTDRCTEKMAAFIRNRLGGN